MKSDQVTKCPVCGMQVDDHKNEVVYLQMSFGFCSEQCRVRFLAHPHLYTGYPGAPAPKQEGQVVLKRRRLHLDQPLSTEQVTLVEELLGELMGVDAVVAAGDTIEVTYDLLQVGLAELETVLSDAGARLGGTWAGRLRYALIHESEEWELAGREVTRFHHY